MSFEINDEKAVDVLIWWIEGSDGSIDYSEEQVVKKVLEEMDYSLETFYRETMMHINSLSTENVEELVNKSIEWGRVHFDLHKKRLTLALLENIAASTGEIGPDEQKKLTRIKEAFETSN